jgi:hypothetical protein
MVHTEETKRKLSEARKGKNNPFYGKHHTKEVREMLSEKVKIQNSSRQYDLLPQRIVIPLEMDLAYLAGFCDADGSIRFTHPNGKPRPFIAFYNTNKDVISWILEKLQHGSVQYQNKGREQVQSVRIDGARDVYALTNALLPLLIVKRDDALNVINFLREKYGERL